MSRFFPSILIFQQKKKQDKKQHKPEFSYLADHNYWVLFLLSISFCSFFLSHFFIMSRATATVKKKNKRGITSLPQLQLSM